MSELPQPARVVAVWCLVTAATAAALAASRGPVTGLAHARSADADALAEVLVAVFALAGALAALRLWWTTTDVALRLLRGRHPAGPSFGSSVGSSAGSSVGSSVEPGAVRRLVLAACGVAVLQVVGATHAVAAPSLDGLPMPDRSTGASRSPDGSGAAPSDAAPPVGRRSPEAPARLVVRAGDSLWALSRATSGRRADEAEVAAHVERLYRHNRERIGDDPDLIHSGQVLDLPDDRPS